MLSVNDTRLLFGIETLEVFPGIRRGGLRVAPTLFGRAIDSPCPVTFPRHGLSSRYLAAIKVKDANGQALAYVCARETRCRKGDGAASAGLITPLVTPA